jgi:glycosyltransferase involved in cell wall biosynthesis
MRYGIPAKKIQDIATFSPQYIQFARQELTERMEEFLSRHARVLRCYVSFRPEYRRDVFREGMRSFPGVASRLRVGLLGFADSDICRKESVQGWPQEERDAFLLLGNLHPDQFLTLLCSCLSACALPACDGVSASVLESLALGVPVVAGENGRRPAGVVTLSGTNVADMVAKFRFVTKILLGGQVRAPPGDPGRQHGQDGGLAAAESSGSGLMNRA